MAPFSVCLLAFTNRLRSINSMPYLSICRFNAGSMLLIKTFCLTSVPVEACAMHSSASFLMLVNVADSFFCCHCTLLHSTRLFSLCSVLLMLPTSIFPDSFSSFSFITSLFCISRTYFTVNNGPLISCLITDMIFF